ncbi:hypothetical protein D3C87_2030270 [compost metagenome]
MRTDEFYVHMSELVRDEGYQAVLVPANIENGPIVGHDIHLRAELVLDVLRR